MNIWSLNIKSSILENEYGKKEKLNGLKILKVQTSAVVIYSIIQLILLQYASSIHSKIYIYHLLELITGFACYLVCCLRIQTFNYSITLSLAIYISLMIWSYQDNILIDYFQNQSSLRPNQQGFIYAINFIILLIGSSFLLKFSIIIILFVCLIIFVFKNPILDVIQIVSVILALIYKIYSEDKQKRIAFLDHKQGLIRDYLVDNLLPSSLIICKYNQKYNEFELYSQNKRSKLQFGLQNNQEFHDFCNSMVLHNNQNAQEVKQQLKKCKKPEWSNTLSGQIQQKMNKEFKNLQNENKSNKGNSFKQTLKQKNKDKNQSSNNVFQDLVSAQNNEQAIFKNEKDINSFRKLKMSNQKLVSNHVQKNEIKSFQKFKKQNSLTQLQRRITSISGGGLEKSTFQFFNVKGQSQTNNQNQSTDMHAKYSEKENPSQKQGVFSQNFEQFYEDVQEESEEVESFQGQMIDEQYVPIQNKKFSIKILSFFLNDYFIVISIQKDAYREKYQQSVEENKRTNKILDQQFLNLNYLSVNSYKVIKQILQMTHQKQNLSSNNLQIYFEEESKTMNSLLYSAYAIKQNIYNIFEWLNRKKQIYKESIQKINILEELYGMKRIFQKQLETQQKNIEINISNTLQRKYLLTDERVLNQIFYNLINYCIQSSLFQSSITIKANETQNSSNLICFSITFKPVSSINLSLLNFAELYDDNEDHYQQVVEIKICKHLLRLINPQNKISFKLTEDQNVEIYFHLNLQDPQDGVNESLNDNNNRSISDNSFNFNNHSVTRQNFIPSLSQVQQPTSFGLIWFSEKKYNQKPFQEVISEQANSSSFNSNENESKNYRDISPNKSENPKFLENDKNNKMSQFFNYIPKKGDFNITQDTSQDKNLGSPNNIKQNENKHDQKNEKENVLKQINQKKLTTQENSSGELIDLQKYQQQFQQNQPKQLINNLNFNKQIISSKSIDCCSIDSFQEDSDNFQSREIFQNIPKGLSHIQNQQQANDPSHFSQHRLNTFLKNSDSKGLFNSLIHQSQEEQIKTQSVLPHLIEQQNYQHQKILHNSYLRRENDNSELESEQIKNLDLENNQKYGVENSFEENYSTISKQLEINYKNI
ncbi:transmembrane protein, putative (macronuclear) [Tetrahymena thermophila SB210]|uniref:Transmembrane protein, putative n=1 Tax=Tetrahymena thermophila (strain SB210) TaxID=312017 RepID=I7MDW2_TETTS|nr:transmembrane protein, putative [Tetrahymena thermophila SB210]EAR92834.2 transmembrane protein, putative [Tetrahymena thermophila SB210]|eukprot:XP_001013079.2 transmembrane protein, putative [Tetrahymena thermophila SB210]